MRIDSVDYCHLEHGSWMRIQIGSDDLTFRKHSATPAC
jgi:hypothetical protein